MIHCVCPIDDGVLGTRGC